MATLSATRQAVIQASPDLVWRIHTDINGWSGWNRAVTSARIVDSLAVGSSFVWKSGGLSIASVIQALDPVRRIAWSGLSIGTEAKHTWTFLPSGNATLVVTEESMTGWLVSLLKLFAPDFLDKSLDNWLQALKSKSEAAARHGDAA